MATHKGSWELYDLEADRAARHPDKVKELAAPYDRWAKRCGVVPWEKVFTRHQTLAPRSWRGLVSGVW